MVIAYSPKDCINVEIPDPPLLPSNWNLWYDFYADRYLFITPTGKLQREPPNINEKKKSFFSKIIYSSIKSIKVFLNIKN